MSRLCEIRGFVSQSVQVSFACFFCCFYEVVISKLYNYQLYIYIYIKYDYNYHPTPTEPCRTHSLILVDIECLSGTGDCLQGPKVLDFVQLLFSQKIW